MERPPSLWKLAFGLSLEFFSQAFTFISIIIVPSNPTTIDLELHSYWALQQFTVYTVRKQHLFIDKMEQCLDLGRRHRCNLRGKLGYFGLSP